VKNGNWKTVKFGEVVQLEQGLAFNKKTNHLMSDVGIPLLRITDLINNTETKFVNATEVPRKFISHPEDIIYTRTGQVGLVFTGRVGVVHNNCFRIIPKEGIDRAYLYWFLKQPRIIEYARKLAAGVAQPDLGHDAFKSIEFTYPDNIPVQRRIAGILSAYDDLIENNQRRIKILEEMARSLYREWFVNFRFPGYEKVPLVDSPLGRIPKGWEVKKLKDVADVNRAQITARTAPEELHYIDISSVSPGQINAITTYSFAEAPGRARRIVQHGDVLWSCVCPNRRSHGLIMHPTPNTIASTGFAVLSATAVPFTFLYAATTTDDFVGYLTNRATGAAYPAVTAATFEKADLLIPPDPLLRKFGEATTSMTEQTHILQCQISNLHQTRDVLLPRLLSGEIVVATYKNANGSHGPETFGEARDILRSD